ncbi:MAG: ABC transporter substrate-binding protein [Anabaena sp. CoA2_C59]|jgi:branched-chain amino acid transport system substrate-binding protein|nr:ABC transporter substrate-binding protein [Anabaena sp. CoA2_C59]
MKSQNETKLLVFSLLFTTTLLGLGFLLWNQFKLPTDVSQKYNIAPDADSTLKRISLGEKILITDQINSDKEKAVEAFAQGDFEAAKTNFQASLRQNHNDPESLIYLHNSLGSSSNYIKIAVSVPIGGNLNVAKEILRGVAQAQDEVNRNGGINGKLLQVAIANDDNDPTQVQQIATHFVKDSSILAVVGHNASNASITAAPIYQQGGLVMISPTSFAQNLSGIGSYIFRTVPNISSQSEPLAVYTLKTANKTNVALCVDSKSIDNQSFRDEYAKNIVAGGGKINPTKCDFSAADFNPTTMISQLISSGADALVLAPYIGRINQALELAAANQGKLALFGSPTLYTFQTLESGKSDINGMVLAVPWHPKAILDNPFVQKATKLWGGKVNWRSATAYDATMSIAKGLQQAYTREALQKVLHSPGFFVNGATGKIEFQDSGDIKGKAILVKVQPSKSLTVGYDFFPLQ